MAINKKKYKEISTELTAQNVQLVAVSKLKSTSDIVDLYELGQKDFGENYVQELVEKQDTLKHLNINWHFIGHLQTNKVKHIAGFVHLIQSVDSLKLLQEIDKQAAKNNRIIDCLLQVFIATEETKFGLNENEIGDIFNELNFGNLPNISIKGFMGMASLTTDETTVSKEFHQLLNICKKFKISNPTSQIISMGMSQDYKLAIAAGSNLVRIGSLLFGKR